MTVFPFPELAGLATYAEAARVGHSVEANVKGLLRLHWAERRLMQLLTARIPAIPEWELKCALALHQWLCAQRADAIRRRIAEMRQPAPPLDLSPSPELDEFFGELFRAETSADLVEGAYAVAFPALDDAYRAHGEAGNPLVDQPTRLLIQHARVDLEMVIAWGERAQSAGGRSPKRSSESDRRRADLTRLLRADNGADKTGPAVSGEAALDMHPRRAERFTGQYNFEFPPHTVYNDASVPADERNLALLCKRTLEMDVPETIASFLTERTDQPWEFYLDYSRQLWDEARHAMMGTVALAQGQWGFGVHGQDRPPPRTGLRQFRSSAAGPPEHGGQQFDQLVGRDRRSRRAHEQGRLVILVRAQDDHVVFLLGTERVHD
jgi:hypothetical protein